MESIQESANLNFRSLLTAYTSTLLKQLKAIPFILDKLNDECSRERNSYLQFIQNNNLDNAGGEGETSTANLQVPQDKVDEHDLHYNNIESIMTIQETILTTQYIYSVTQFDSFLQNLMRCIYRMHPEHLKSNTNTIQYKELFGFTSVNDIKSYLVENIIDELFRKSHKDILEQFNKLSKVDVAKEMPELYKRFVEITERRNVLVHCNGVASKQYINVCKQNNITITVREGDVLPVNIDIFKDCIEVLLELSVKIGFLIWNKLDKGDRVNSDTFIDNICNSLISQSNYKLAIALIDFLSNHKESNMTTAAKHKLKMYWIFAHKKLNNQEKVTEGLGEDWSSVKPLISLILAILKGEYTEAENIIRRNGNFSNEIPVNMYATSVLFSDFIKSENFASVYSELYGSNFTYDRKRLFSE